MCQPIIRSKETNKVFLNLVTEHLVIQLLPLFGIELERPWTSLAAIRKQAEEKLQSESISEISELKKQVRSYERTIADQNRQIESLKRDVEINKVPSRWPF